MNMTDDEVLEAIRALGGTATATQILAQLGIKRGNAETDVLVAIGRLLHQGKIQRDPYKQSGGYYYTIMGNHGQ